MDADCDKVQLRERVKELQCLYRVAELSGRPELQARDYANSLPELLPPGWFYPESLAVRLTYRQQNATTPNFAETPWRMHAALQVGSQHLGTLEVFYLEEHPLQQEGPFMTEERALLDALASHIAQTLARKEMEEHLRRSQQLEALGLVAGGVAHDFNNLLGIINLLTEQARSRDRADPAIQEDLNEILGVVERSQRMADRLLNFVNQKDGQPEVLDLNAFLQDSSQLLSRLLGPATALDLDLDPQSPHLCIDPTSLDQILANLAINARDAMPQGGRFQIGTRRHGDQAHLICQDTGHGMGEAALSRLFEPFFSTKDRGLGLGLATVEHAVQKAGGVVEVTSEPGVGTRFLLRFPQAARAPEGVPAPLSEPPRPITILLVDNEPMIRYLGQRVLETLGYQVLVADGPEQARALCGQESTAIDLLLVDWGLPETNGQRLADQLRAQRPGLKVLLTSGYNAPSVHYPLLRKPFNRATLGQSVERALSLASPEARP